MKAYAAICQPALSTRAMQNLLDLVGRAYEGPSGPWDVNAIVAQALLACSASTLPWRDLLEAVASDAHDARWVGVLDLGGLRLTTGELVACLAIRPRPEVLARLPWRPHLHEVDSARRCPGCGDRGQLVRFVEEPRVRRCTTSTAPWARLCPRCGVLVALGYGSAPSPNESRGPR